MKKIISFLIALLLSVSAVSLCMAENTESLDASLLTVYATYKDQKVDVTRQVMEIDGSLAAPVQIQVSMGGDTAGYKYSIIQYDGSSKKTVTESSKTEFQFYPNDLKVNTPLYISVTAPDGKNAYTRILNFRINIGEAEKRTPVNVGTEFGSGVLIDLSEFVPGMQFNLMPCLIPVTAREYPDGRYVVGFGVNSSDVSFWNNVAKGTQPEDPDADALREAFNGDGEKKSAISGKQLGWTMIVSGYLQGNMNTDEPLRGKLSFYVGNGFDVVGQYSILTWEITLTGGVDGNFQFSFVYDEASSKYAFQPDAFIIGWKSGLEFLGGLGLARIFTVGLYGAGSFAGQNEFYPAAGVDHLILAGECGIKLKVFGKNILVFKIVSGSHDFIRHSGNGEALLAEPSEDYIQTQLLANGYASIPLLSDEPEGEAVWHTGTVDTNEANNIGALEAGTANEADYAKKIAENIYSDNLIKLVRSGSRAVPQMNGIFLGNDSSRPAGNRSRLMNFYFNLANDFLSDPAWIEEDSEDDGTADFEPFAYHDDSSGNTYLVWRNAMGPLPEKAALEEIAAGSDVFITEITAGIAWHKKERITEYAGDDSGLCAVCARVGADKDGNPVVCWYTSSVHDPAGADRSFTHEIWTAERKNGSWVRNKVAEVTGSVKEVSVDCFRGSPAVAVSYRDTDGMAVVELWQSGNKVWTTPLAEAARFVHAGFGFTNLIWYEQGGIWSLNERMESSRITPKDIPIPSSNYEIYGKFGSSSVMIVGTSNKDSKADLYGLLSSDGGVNWKRINLSAVEEFSAVNHSGIAFTYEDEPVVVYSVQNYDINYDPDSTDAEKLMKSGNVPETLLKGRQALLVGTDDERFTDTQTDLYLKARDANRHVTITKAVFPEEDTAMPQRTTPLQITVENNGLLDVDEITVLVHDLPVKTVPVSLKPGETAQLTVDVFVSGYGNDKEPMKFPVAVSTHTGNIPDSRYTAELGMGHLSTFIEHEYIDGKEQITYHVKNYGFTNKFYRVVVRDEEADRTLYNEYWEIQYTQERINSFSSSSGLFVKDGIKKLTLYILLDGETIEDDIPSVRRLTVVPLDEIYGQKIDNITDENEEEPAPTPTPAPKPAPTETPAPTPVPKPAPSETPAPAPGTTPVPSPGPVPSPTAEPAPEPTPAPETTASPEPAAGEAAEDPHKENEQDISKENEKKTSSWAWVLAIPVLGAIALIYFLVWGRRKDKEE